MNLADDYANLADCADGASCRRTHLLAALGQSARSSHCGDGCDNCASTARGAPTTYSHNLLSQRNALCNCTWRALSTWHCAVVTVDATSVAAAAVRVVGRLAGLLSLRRLEKVAVVVVVAAVLLWRRVNALATSAREGHGHDYNHNNSSTAADEDAALGRGGRSQRFSGEFEGLGLSPECGGPPQAFRCSPRSPWLPAAATPRRPF